MDFNERSTSSTVIARPPTWWTKEHTSSWDRVKDALKRDWEQTKNDFSRKAGEKLNQNAADTIKQAAGKEAVPPLAVKTRPTPPKEAAKDAEKAREDVAAEAKKVNETIAKRDEAIAKEHQKLGEKVQDAQKDLAKNQAKAGEKIADAHAKLGETVEKADKKVAEAAADHGQAIARWRDAEQEARYGYSVRSQYPNAAWDDTLEGKLRREWDELGTGRSWEDSKRGIRHGWDYAGRKL